MYQKTQIIAEIDAILLFLSSRRLHTSSKRDWSSDVCSSDLRDPETIALPELAAGHLLEHALPERRLGGIRAHDRERAYGSLRGLRDQRVEIAAHEGD